MARRQKSERKWETYIVRVKPRGARAAGWPVFFVEAGNQTEADQEAAIELRDRGVPEKTLTIVADLASLPENDSAPQAREANRKQFNITGDDWYPNERHELQAHLGSRSEEQINLCPPPERTYKVGDKLYGGHEVLKVFEGGKFYLTRRTWLDTSVHSRTRGQTQVREHAYAWYDLFPLGSFSDVLAPIGDDTLARVSQSLQSRWDEIYHMTFSQGIDMDPPYQRGHVWSLEDKQKLIESLLHHREVGTFVFRRIPFKESVKRGYWLEIVDGKQRLQAVIDYRLGRFQVRGRYYHELHPKDRYGLEDNMFRYSIINDDVPLAKVIEIFVMLNVTGKPMDPAVIEKAKAMLEDMKKEEG